MEGTESGEENKMNFTNASAFHLELISGTQNREKQSKQRLQPCPVEETKRGAGGQKTVVTRIRRE